MKKVQIALIKLINTVDPSVFSSKIKKTAIQTKPRIIHFNSAHTHKKKKSQWHSQFGNLSSTPPPDHTSQIFHCPNGKLGCPSGLQHEGQHTILWQLNTTEDYWPREHPATRQS